jgi:hypothetical protein
MSLKCILSLIARMYFSSQRILYIIVKSIYDQTSALDFVYLQQYISLQTCAVSCFECTEIYMYIVAFSLYAYFCKPLYTLVQYINYIRYDSHQDTVRFIVHSSNDGQRDISRRPPIRVGSFVVGRNPTFVSEDR